MGLSTLCLTNLELGIKLKFSIEKLDVRISQI